jgi:hypothetical protein
LAKVEPRNKQLTTSETRIDETTAQTTNLPLRRNNWINNNNKNLDLSSAQVNQNAKSWDKSYASRRTYKSSWSSDQPFRERLIETEWDDDMPVRHVVRDSWDDKEIEDLKSVKEQYDKPNRQLFTDYRADNEEVVNPEKDYYVVRKINKNRQLSVSSLNTRNELPKADKLISNNDNWDKSSKLIDEKLPKLATNGFNNQNKENRELISNKDTDVITIEDLVKPVKPKLKVIFETGTIKTDKPSAKLIENNNSNNGNNSSLRSANKQFGWRSSINHSINKVESNTERQSQTLKPKAATTNSYSETQTTLRPKPIEPILTTIRSTTKAPKVLNILSETVVPSKPQVGSWVDSDGYDVPGDGFDDDWVDAPIRSQPLLDEEVYDDNINNNDNFQPPVERVEERNPPKSAAQRESLEDNVNEAGIGWRLEDALPGSPGSDYPTYASIPRTSFDCKSHQWPGYYADVEAQCQVS